jgi:hypothetical protein
MGGQEGNDYSYQEGHDDSAFDVSDSDNFSKLEPEVQEIIERIGKQYRQTTGNKGTQAGEKKGKKDKRAFRTEVQEARVVAANKEVNNKKSKVMWMIMHMLALTDLIFSFWILSRNRCLHVCQNVDTMSSVPHFLIDY